jgi:CBS domain-containing protein
MSVGEYCNREVVVISKSGSVREAVTLMRSHHVGDVVVVDKEGAEPIPLGILTDRDIVLEILAEDVDLDAVNVGDVMSYELVTVDEDTKLIDAIKIMKGKGVRRLPVVNKADVLVGILTVDDVIELITEQLGDIVTLISRENAQEQRRR